VLSVTDSANVMEPLQQTHTNTNFKKPILKERAQFLTTFFNTGIVNQTSDIMISVTKLTRMIVNITNTFLEFPPKQNELGCTIFTYVFYNTEIVNQTSDIII
jgi:hypothetical protein